MRTLEWDYTKNELRLIDQRRLPEALEMASCRTYTEVAEAIRNMTVRGAPAIGAAAAFGLALAAKESKAQNPAALLADLESAARLLKASRPTAVNLAWALDRIIKSVSVRLPPQSGGLSVSKSADKSVLVRESVKESVDDSVSIRLPPQFGDLSVSKSADKSVLVRESVKESVDDSVSIRESVKESVDDIRSLVLAEAQHIADEDVEINKRMAAHGAALIEDGDTIIHHCNTGALAAVDWGTALGVIRLAHEQGKRVHVLVDETRPRLQGARLTAWELAQYGIPYEIITDGMAGHFLRTGQAQKVFFGADRIAANGDVANKIGTYMLALAAHDNGLPVYTVAPTSTVDLSLADGSRIPIEERDADEVLGIQFHGERVAPQGAKARNPAFDVTPHRLITAIVTENGIVYPPFEVNLRENVGAGLVPTQGDHKGCPYKE